MTTIADLMTRDVRAMSPADTVAYAARTMGEIGVGAIPVCEGAKLVGIVTDRDIAVRAVGAGLDPKTAKLSEIMTRDVRWAKEGEDLDEALRDMGKRQIRRLPVVDAAGKLSGILSLGDVASKTNEDRAEVAESLRAISKPS